MSLVLLLLQFMTGKGEATDSGYIANNYTAAVNGLPLLQYRATLTIKWLRVVCTPSEFGFGIDAREKLHISLSLFFLQ